MRLRQRALRGTAAATGAIALVLALAGCVGGETDDGPSGPNGYELGATLDDVTAWVDVSETTGTLDVILERSGESQPVGVCLGGQGTVCLLGQVAEGPRQPGLLEVDAFVVAGGALSVEDEHSAGLRPRGVGARRLAHRAASS